MSATIYGVKQWCTLSPEKINEILDRIKNGFIYKAEDFYNEVKTLDGWRDPYPDDDFDKGVLIWNTDDAGPIAPDSDTGLFVHFNEDKQEFDWACTYEL